MTVPNRGTLTVTPCGFDTHFAMMTRPLLTASRRQDTYTKVWFTRGGETLPTAPDGVKIYRRSECDPSLATTLILCSPSNRDGDGYVLCPDSDYDIEHDGAIIAILRSTRTHTIKPGGPGFSLEAPLRSG